MKKKVNLYVEEEQLKTFMAFLNTLNYVNIEEEESPYNPEFVAKIQQGKKDLEDGKGIKMTLDELDNLWK